MSHNALQIPRRITNVSYPWRNMVPNPELCSQCSRRARLLQARHFSSSRPRNAAMGEMRRAPSNQRQPSMKAKMALMDKKDVGNDLGRLPDTIIMPSAWEDYPKGLKMNALLLWKKFTRNVIGLSSLIYGSKWDVTKDKRTGKRNTHPLKMSGRTSMAKYLHYEMNSAISTGNYRLLKIYCADGLYNQCKRMIDRQKELHSPLQEWHVVKYSGVSYPRLLMIWPLCIFLPGAAVRVVSDKMSAIPFGTQSYIRECIVRIKSEQTFSGPESNNIQKVTEHIVMQQFVLDGEAGDWKIWGTIDPTKEELAAILTGKKNAATSSSFTDQIKERMSTMTGGTF